MPSDVAQHFVRRVGRNIKRGREAQGLSQRQLGELVGCGEIQISKWENGRNLPGARYQEKLAEVLFEGRATELHEDFEEAA